MYLNTPTSNAVALQGVWGITGFFVYFAFFVCFVVQLSSGLDTGHWHLNRSWQKKEFDKMWQFAYKSSRRLGDQRKVT